MFKQDLCLRIFHWLGRWDIYETAIDWSWPLITQEESSSPSRFPARRIDLPAPRLDAFPESGHNREDLRLLGHHIYIGYTLETHVCIGKLYLNIALICLDRADSISTINALSSHLMGSIKGIYYSYSDCTLCCNTTDINLKDSSTVSTSNGFPMSRTLPHHSIKQKLHANPTEYPQPSNCAKPPDIVNLKKLRILNAQHRFSSPEIPPPAAKSSPAPIKKFHQRDVIRRNWVGCPPNKNLTVVFVIHRQKRQQEHQQGIDGRGIRDRPNNIAAQPRPPHRKKDPLFLFLF
ncbi:hypothetical protein CEXT_86181 [Caerostris extrusa]|uniref:Uncharacterized protein n=1 Tax=Caerostris extrusa TaxID=172846 RepID=A0AAV4WSW0_CAEEX|nr:hypothetical protein CEXT_86181 [Caerostris extrusa]